MKAVPDPISELPFMASPAGRYLSRAMSVKDCGNCACAGGCPSATPLAGTPGPGRAVANGGHARPAANGAPHKPRGSRSYKRAPAKPSLSLSCKILIGIFATYGLSILCMLFLPEVQGLLLYLHWVKIPFFRDLQDLRSFRLPHARHVKVRVPHGRMTSQEVMICWVGKG
jgi:hypothetical protein